jgi:hypothetical protein
MTLPTAPDIQNHIDICCNRYLSAVVPLFKIHPNNDPYHSGTAFGLDINSHKFIVTAKHVLARDEQNESDSDNQIFLAVNGVLRQMEKFNPISIALPGEPPLDVLLIEPAEFSVEDVFTLCLNEGDAFCENLPNEAYLSAIGFPSSKNKKRWEADSVTQAPYGYFGKASEREKLKKEKSFSEASIGLEIQLKKVFRDGLKGVKAPDPSGISGGPIFYVHDFSNPLEKINPRLYGLVTNKSPDGKRIMGVHIRHIIRAAKQYLHGNG